MPINLSINNLGIDYKKKIHFHQENCVISYRNTVRFTSEDAVSHLTVIGKTAAYKFNK